MSVFIVVDKTACRPYSYRKRDALAMSEPSRRVRQAIAGAVLCVTLCVTLCEISGIAWAQRITVDGRLSPAQTLIGPNYQIGAGLGRQVGGNLFHSFGAFGLNTNETATFSGPTTVNNIIGRVTG